MAKPEAGKPLQPIIIIKKIKKGGHGGAHGGAWKIAYADFVTAMMAFFLLMWLLSYTDPGTRAGIADYFNRPLKSLLMQGPAAGVIVLPENKKEKDAAKKKADEKKLEELKKKLDSVTEHNPKLRAFKNQIKIEITTEGLRVQIIDQKNRPMFAVGSAVLEDYTKVILDVIGKTLNNVDNPVSIAGHTDALQYAGGDKGYSNWELSSERANAARRELIFGGMNQNKVMQVRGLAGSVPFTKDLSNPSNRRISIVVLNNETVQRLKEDGTAAPLETITAEDTGGKGLGQSTVTTNGAAAKPAGAEAPSAAPADKAPSDKPSGADKAPSAEKAPADKAAAADKAPAADKAATPTNPKH